MPTTRGNSKTEPSDDRGPTDVPTQSGKEKPEMSGQDAEAQQVLAAIASLRSELAQARSDICNKIEEKIADVSKILREEITSLREESDNAFNAVNARVDTQSETLKSLEESANATSDIVVKLRTQVKQLNNQVDKLSEKCLDLEGRSKRQNLRIAGVKEGQEHSQRTRDFVAQLLTDVLKLDVKPVIDRAHRALRERPGDNDPPRHLILRVHYYHDLEDIMQKISKTKNLQFHGQRIQIFRDFPPAVVKRRAAFTPARNLLRDKPGVKFGLLYPAKLRVTHDGNETTFTDPEEACRYAERHFGQRDN